MKVILNGSKNGISKLPLTFEKLISFFNSKNIQILGPYTQSYSDVLHRSELRKYKGLQRHSIFMRKVIKQADFMVVETTFDGFALGHEATIALEEYKPVLAISRDKKDFSYIYNNRFSFFQYRTVEDIPSILSKFIEEFENTYRTIRVNVLLHQRHLNYLKSTAKERNKNQSLIIRELIDNCIENDNR